LNRKGAAQLSAHYNLAGIYATIGKREKVYYYLEQIEIRRFHSYYDNFRMKASPLFDNIRHEEQFQTIARSMEAKYQKERERVRIWLEENDML